MAGGVAQVGAVSVRLRRAVAGRAVQRLLILGGVLVAGWLLGCATQDAHAGEVPVEPARVVEDAVGTARRLEPVRRVVRAAAEKPPHGEVVTPASPLPEASEAQEVVRAAGVPAVSAADAAQTPDVHRRMQVRRSAVSEVAQPAPILDSHASPQVVERHQAPERSDGHSVGGSTMPAVTAGLPNVAAWAPAPPRASGSRGFGAVPPAVRAAADEPSFAPD